MAHTQSCSGTPAALVAIIQAARRTGDRETERAAKTELSKRFGIKLVFTRRTAEGVPDGQ